MKKNKSCHGYPAPPADMVLDLIRSAPGTDNNFLSLYTPYISQAAVERIYSADGCCCSTCLNEDLWQEISINFVRSLVPLRRKIIQYLNGECILVLVVPPSAS